tara:strand:- start:1034 stop:1141 length:108 start_codon:yes stop_codon:yes gene_type:complete
MLGINGQGISADELLGGDLKQTPQKNKFGGYTQNN